jgi:OFA family oxalate/formate antiporter-like MFS transporter
MVARVTPRFEPRGHRAVLIARLPFYYGWLVLGAVCCAGFARQGPAVAVLSIFVEPMTREFGWSRAALSGAVSLGGVLGALSAPVLGPVLDRHGARLVLCLAVLGSGLACMLLSLTPSLVVFYLLFCFARMIWAGPFDLGIYGALNNWFVARRAFVNAIATLAQSLGLVALPLLAQLAMAEHGWRAGWLAIGATVLVIGFVPTWLLLVRRPEDVGLVPDRVAPAAAATAAATAPPPLAEPSFSRREALGTRAFWLLGLFTMLVYPVQAGLSLHQAAHLIERGVAPTTAAAIVSTFSLMSAIASLGCAFLPRALPIRYPLALCGGLFGVAALAMIDIGSVRDGYLAACLFGLGIGGILTLVPGAWADYFGRRSYGAIRGLALAAQVTAQAAGPLLSGALRDLTGDYTRSLQCFAAVSFASVLIALLARRPPVP